MGSGSSLPNKSEPNRHRRQRTESPDDTLFDRNIKQEHGEQQPKRLAPINKRARSKPSSCQNIKMDIAQMANENAWLTSLQTAPPRIKHSNTAAVLPNIPSWPQEATPIDKVMIGRHRSDRRLASTPRRSEHGSNKTVKKAKVICYLPAESLERCTLQAPEPKQRHRILSPLKKTSRTKTLRSPVETTFNPIEPVPAIARSPKMEPNTITIRRANVLLMAAVPYERATKITSTAKCHSVGARVRRCHAIASGEKKTESFADTTTPVFPVEYTSTPHRSFVQTLRRYGKVETALVVDLKENSRPLCYVKHVGVTSAVAFERALAVGLKENSSPFCSMKPVGVTSAVKSSYIESASAHGKRQLNGINAKEAPGYFYYSACVNQYPNPWRALGVLPPPNEVMGVSTFVQTNDLLQRAHLNRQLTTVNVVKAPSTRRAVSELLPTQVGMVIGEITQTDDSLHEAVKSKPRTYFVRPTQRCQSACLEAVQKVDYDQMYRIVGEEKVEEKKPSPKLHIPKDGRFRLPPIRLNNKPGPKILQKNSRGDSQTPAIIPHRMGFFPGIVKEQPVISFTKMINRDCVEDLVPPDGRYRLPPIRGTKKHRN